MKIVCSYNTEIVELLSDTHPQNIMNDTVLTDKLCDWL